MLEIIVRVLRAVACRSRLRILALVAREPEIAPTELVARLGMPMNVLSTHLRRLSQVGLIVRRRSGPRNYCIARSPYGDETLSGKVTAWLTGLLRDPVIALKACGERGLAGLSQSKPEELISSVIFDAATAFTDVRRLQIMRRLYSNGETTTAALTQELSMSDRALGRHVAKLARRGYILSARGEGRLLVHSPATSARTPAHASLLAIVRSEWEAS